MMSLAEGIESWTCIRYWTDELTDRNDKQYGELHAMHADAFMPLSLQLGISAQVKLANKHQVRYHYID